MGFQKMMKLTYQSVVSYVLSYIYTTENLHFYLYTYIKLSLSLFSYVYTSKRKEDFDHFITMCIVFVVNI